MFFTVSGYSTALFSTWYFIEELDLLLDAGDGLMATLLQKSGKIRHVFVSHADRDHLTGLHQLLQLNARPGIPCIYYPRDAGSFPALADFTARFDVHTAAAAWLGVGPDDAIGIAKDTYVRPLLNGHVRTAAGQIKSLSYKIIRRKKKLRQAYSELAGRDIARLRKELGDDAVMETVDEVLLGYSGDTPVETPDRWRDTPVLIHEATFLLRSETGDDTNRRNYHSSLEEVMDMTARLPLKALVLGHFSTRYTAEQIDEAIREHCTRLHFGFPVYRLLPGQTERNIFAGPPLWPGHSTPQTGDHD